MKKYLIENFIRELILEQSSPGYVFNANANTPYHNPWIDYDEMPSMDARYHIEELNRRGFTYVTSEKVKDQVIESLKRSGYKFTINKKSVGWEIRK